MVSKRELEEEVAVMRNQLSGAAADAVDAGKAAVSGARRAVELHLDDETKEQFRTFAEAQGMAMDELKHLGERLLGELRHMPQKKPLVTLLGAFVLGIVIGRMSRK